MKNSPSVHEKDTVEVIREIIEDIKYRKMKRGEFEIRD